MLKHQKLKTRDGTEVLLFPLDICHITQGYADDVLWLSHEATKAIDIIGRHSNYPIYMPCTARCVSKWDLGNGNGVVWESLDKVLFASGKIDYCHFVFWHDTNISDFNVGDIYEQGQECQDTGVSGIGSGDHCHFEIGIGKAPKGYPLLNTGHKTHFGNGREIPTLSLKNAVRPEDAVFINDTEVIKNSFGIVFKEYKESDFCKSGWLWDDKLKGQTYYKDNVMAKDEWVWDKDSWYYLTKDGKMARSQFVSDNKGTYYVEESGKMAVNKELTFTCGSNGAMTVKK